MDTFSSYSKNLRVLENHLAKLPEVDRKKIQRALTLAVRSHAGQQRDVPDPEGGGYVIHCVRAAHWLLEQGCADANIIIATLLHDTLEDTALTPAEIERQFGGDVLQLVLSVTRLRPADEPLEIKVREKAKMFEKILKSNGRTRLIKTADMLDNMRSWLELRPHHPTWKKLPRWFTEATQHYIPIAESVSRNAAQEMRNILQDFQRSYQ